ncbi:F-box/WD repeat-containing protein 7-like [Pollicipes pollicipes]|uniref:F-box/WD repeat-containing protein 7-like n=1 Tax=Pollicipes pollicipes TaxID=41117 RepID=UPI001885289F|nr:F-box/WD repeat-containing protein 7-like [Pollicipes pollicipes]
MTLCRDLEVDGLDMDMSTRSTEDMFTRSEDGLAICLLEDVKQQAPSETATSRGDGMATCLTRTASDFETAANLPAKNITVSHGDRAVDAAVGAAEEGSSRTSPPSGRDGELGRGSAGFRRLLSLLSSLDRRELLCLQQQAHDIMFPDFSSWLPDEILMDVLSRLSPRDLVRAGGASRRWQALAGDEGVWRRCCRLTGADPTGEGGMTREGWMQWLGWTELPLLAPKVLKGHDAVIRCMDVDGDRIVTGSSDKTVAVWSAAAGRLETRMSGQSEVTCVQVLGDLVVSAGRDCCLLVWDAATGRLRHRLTGHDGIVWSVALHGARAASCSDDKTARLWDVVAGTQKAVLRGHETVVRVVCFDGRRLVSGDDAGCVRVWNAETRADEHVWQARSRYIMVLQYGFGVVVSGHSDGAVHVWDTGTGRLRHHLTGHTGWVTGLCLRHDRLLSGCRDGTAILWNISDGGVVHRLGGANGHRQRLTRDGRVKLWNTRRGTLVRDLVTPDVSGGPVKHVWADPGRLVCAVQNNTSDRPREIAPFL